MSRRLMMVVAALQSIACGGSEPAGRAFRAEVGLALQEGNGHSLNGHSLNGHSLNGHSLNGHSLNGVALGGVALGGRSQGALSLDGSSLVVVGDGGVRRGADLAGLRLSGVLDDGRTLPLRIDAVEQGGGANAALTYYDVSYLADGGWSPLCGTDDGGAAIAALALEGTWDSGQGTATGGAWSPSRSLFTFGCRLHGAVAKCVELGYRPWETVKGTALRNHHQSCTRMIRADYCGNGISWTKDGRLVDVYDSLQIETRSENWFFEAEWTGQGARCLSSMRVIDLKNTFGVVDQCILRKVNLFCGQTGGFGSGTLIMNQYANPSVLGLSL